MHDPITLDVTVPVGQEQAFDAFVLRINDWWPMASYSFGKGAVSMEPKLGGFITETAPDGARFTWGHVTRWDRPNLLELAWYVGRTEETATQITVTFEGAGEATQITLVQTGWEALGDAAAEMRTRNIAGWRTIIGEHFVNFVSKQPESS